MIDVLQLLRALAPYRKAILTAVLLGVVAAIPLVNDGVTAADVLTILAAALGGGGGVYAIPNAARVQDRAPGADDYDHP